MKANPFSLSFGLVPDNYISRFSQTDEILEAFTAERGNEHVFMIEQDILALLNDNEKTKVQDIREKLNMTSSSMSVYRDRLNKKGLIDISRFGYLSLKLPRFSAITRIWVE